MKKLQEEIKIFCQVNGLIRPVEYQLLDMVSELGEVAKEILRSSDYGKKPVEYKEELKQELGDVLYSLITVANGLDIDLELAVKQAIVKYQARLTKGSPGSEND
ncbi:MazG-like family protein [Patescibacteria group bacterium]|nr:MazG-like family protein [Patescibacteria group bacterium]